VSRPTRHDTAMEWAVAAAKRSTCNRLNVGCVIAEDGRPLATGYNGPPKGRPHCRHKPTQTDPCIAAIHAERNAIIWAARKGVAIEGADMYVTHMPCLSCAGDIIQAGIATVRYIYPFRDPSGVDLLNDANVQCVMHDVREWVIK
jgi:dCMP deaminase